MTLTQFLDGLDRWGSTLSQWPGPDRAEAETLLQESDAAREALAREKALDSLLQTGDPADDPDIAISLQRVMSGALAAAASRPAPARSPLPRPVPKSGLPKLGRIGRLLYWLEIPDPDQWGRPLAIATAAALVLGLSLGLLAPVTPTTTAPLTSLEQLAMTTPYSPLDLQ